MFQVEKWDLGGIIMLFIQLTRRANCNRSSLNSHDTLRHMFERATPLMSVRDYVGRAPRDNYEYMFELPLLTVHFSICS